MKLPWVSREAYESAERRADGLVESVNAWIEWGSGERKRYDALLEKYHALKLQGATSPPPVVPFTPKAADPYDELKELIAEQTGTDLRRRGMMLRQLKQDRQDGFSADEIRRKIETGITPDGVPV